MAIRRALFGFLLSAIIAMIEQHLILDTIVPTLLTNIERSAHRRGSVMLADEE
jgi:hypothetical protein